jgi:hypothetical protein
MDVVESLEMRWFLAPERAELAELEQWFAGVAAEQDGRLDHYYVDPRSPELGLKQRCEPGKPAKLELKLRTGALGAVALAPGVLGELERWTKLSLSSGAPEIAAHPQSIAVSKRRKLRKLSFCAGEAAEVPSSERPDAGCSVELTRIEASRGAGRIVAHTFGLEAFGAESELLGALEASAHRLFAERPGLRLEAASSSGYPSWLSRLAFNSDVG